MCGGHLRCKHGIDLMHSMQHGCLLSSKRYCMHELRCGDIRDFDGSDQLHELQCWDILDIGWSISIVNMHRLCGRRLCCKHRIDVMRIMQHGHLLSGDR